MMKRQRITITLLLLAFALAAASCATVGRRFPDEKVLNLTIGQTTKDDVRVMFGQPWRTGYEDDMETWTYGFYQYRLIGDTDTTDLVIRFGDNGVVKSYSYNTTKKLPQ